MDTQNFDVARCSNLECEKQCYRKLEIQSTIHDLDKVCNLDNNFKWFIRYDSELNEAQPLT